jgi:GTP diphosphokinase / guanosine-3',5'-bis(diphosphate) 3'-diphosphatase
MESICEWAIQHQEIKDLFDDLLSSCYHCQSEESKNKIIRAFNIACEAHKEQKRNSGEPYITHPLAVAKIVGSELGLGTTSIMCALLHDVVEDNQDYTLDYINELFGPKVAYIVDGLTKLSDVYDENSNLQVENFLKMIRTIPTDIRVIFIKLADRLHNMRTLEGKNNPNKWLKTTGETLFIYAPLAHRLGLHAVKAELEDLSFKYRLPEKYDVLKNKIKLIDREHNQLFDQIQPLIEQKLKDENISFQIIRKNRSVHSIWRKIQRHQIPLREVSDVATLAIIFKPEGNYPDFAQCWRIHYLLLQLNDYFSIRTDKIKDYSKLPRANGYRALILPVMYQGVITQVQILSENMNEIAERGLAAMQFHQQSDNSISNELLKWIHSIDEQLSNSEGQRDSIEFFEDIKLSLFSSDIHVFTPRGDYRTLPKGSTLLDFAFEIHSDLGYKCEGGYVNEVWQLPNYILKNYDQVYIKTDEKIENSNEWLDFVKTTKAIAYIKSLFSEANKDTIKTGRDILNNLLYLNQIKSDADTYGRLKRRYNYRTKDEFYYKIGLSDIKQDEILAFLKTKAKVMAEYPKLSFQSFFNTLGLTSGNGQQMQAQIKKSKTFVVTREIDPSSYKMATCCKPLPGDELIAWENEDKKIEIHKKECPVSIEVCAKGSCIAVQVDWTTEKKESYLTRITLQGQDRMKLMHDITTVISQEMHVNMNAINIKCAGNLFSGVIDLYVHNIEDLNRLIEKLRKVKSITSVEREEISDLYFKEDI